MYIAVNIFITCLWIMIYYLYSFILSKKYFESLKKYNLSDKLQNDIYSRISDYEVTNVIGWSMMILPLFILIAACEESILVETFSDVIILGFLKNWYIYFSLFILIAFCIYKYIKYYKDKEFLERKNVFEYNYKMDYLRNLIDDLENRKNKLNNFGKDYNDKYRDLGIVQDELNDLDKSISLIKKTYSYLEMNRSLEKINEGYNELKNTDIEDDKLKEFEKVLDTINAKRVLNGKIDTNIEQLKKKYK